MIHAFGSYVMSQCLPSAKVILYSNTGHGFLFQYDGVVGTASSARDPGEEEEVK